MGGKSLATGATGAMGARASAATLAMSLAAARAKEEMALEVTVETEAMLVVESCPEL